MLQYMNVHPQPTRPEPEDLYLDTRVRANLDRAGEFVESGALGSFGPTSPGTNFAGEGGASEAGPTVLESA